MKAVNLSDFIYDFSTEDIAELSISDGGETICGGDIIYPIILEYSYRNIIMPAEFDTAGAYRNYFLFYKYQPWLSYRLPDIVKMFDALWASYDPLSDSSYYETIADILSHGDKTYTRTPDETHNKTTTSNAYDYTTTDQAMTANKPTYSNYVTTYDNASPRLESQRIDQGGREQRTQASANNNVKTITDDLKIVKTESHGTTTLTVGDTSYTADEVKGRIRQAYGQKDRTAQELIEQTLKLHMNSALHDIIYDFIQKHTYYAGDMLTGRCYL